MVALRSGLLFAFVCVFVAAPALAEPVPGGDVHVERSDRAFDCPSEAELVKAALALGAAPATPGVTPISIAVRFDRSPSSYLATVSATGEKEGERVLRTDDADCKRLADSVAVVLALLLDLVPPEVAAARAAPASAEPAPKAAPPAAAKPPPAAPPLTPPAPPPPSSSEPAEPLVASVRAEGAFAYGLLGAVVSPYVGGALALGRGRVTLALGGDWVAPSTVSFAPLSPAKVRVWLAYGFVDGCFRAVRSTSLAWDGSICARFAAGALAGAGRGFDQDFSTHDPWFAAGPVAVLRYRFGRVFSLRLDALALVALGHQRLRVHDYGSAFQSLPLAAGLAAGPEVSIW
ncbi:MAG TPA: hypothetical protein VMI54_14780 [Polyangiaceae bacterium]|nr:hypothetical protein [Polyangiaceae bacterium]